MHIYIYIYIYLSIYLSIYLFIYIYIYIYIYTTFTSIKRLRFRVTVFGPIAKENVPIYERNMIV